MRLERPGKHRDVSVTETEVTIAKRNFRQLAVRGLGRDQPTLLLTNRREMTAKQLIERYAKRWLIENQLSAQIRAFHLDALSSQVPLAVDLDTTLSVIADSIYRHFALRLSGYQTATPDTIFRHFIKTPGQLHITPEGVHVQPRTTHPHPRPARRRLPPTHHHHPLVGRPPPHLQLPARLTLRAAKLGRKGVPVIQAKPAADRASAARAKFELGPKSRRYNTS